MFTRLLDEQISSKMKFVSNYMKSKNAADGSLVDSNANVESKNVATLAVELNKDFFIQINRAMLQDKLRKRFDPYIADSYITDLTSHDVYTHDETSAPGVPYCVSISMYPFLINGTKDINGISNAPKHLDSFCGSFVNLIFAISSQFAGAIATSEFFLCFDHFSRKDYGENYLETHTEIIKNRLQEVVYCINQPATARGFQSAFWNISVFDESFFNGMFGNFIFPDGSKPNYNSLDKLQLFFLNWFREERKKAILTFPVVTVCMKTNPALQEPEHFDFSDGIAEEMSKGNSFFIYQSESVDSLSSCCRLRSAIDTKEFSSTLGVLGVMTGSVHVMTLNLNRIIQKCHKSFISSPQTEPFMVYLKEHLSKLLDRIYKYHVAFRDILQDFLNAKMLPIYQAGFIDMKKQFSTIGINGLLEGCEYLGFTASNNQEYIFFMQQILKHISESNQNATKKYGIKINSEFVPAENLGYKNALNDRIDGYFVPREIYNSYFYPVESHDINILDKFILHGSRLNKYLDGGSALHLNLAEHLTKQQYLKLFKIACKTGCNYWCVNVKMTICNECNHIDYKTLQLCPSCSSSNIDYATRIIGYLKRISSFSSPRQREQIKRYHTMEKNNDLW